MADQIGAAGLAVLRELLPVGAAVDDRDGDGQSALWHAAWRGELGVVVHLAEKLGASTTLAANGATPLSIAAFGGHLAVVQWLAGHGGSVTQPSNGGTTPLAIARLKKRTAVVGWLEANGAR